MPTFNRIALLFFSALFLAHCSSFSDSHKRAETEKKYREERVKALLDLQKLTQRPAVKVENRKTDLLPTADPTSPFGLSRDKENEKQKVERLLASVKKQRVSRLEKFWNKPVVKVLPAPLHKEEESESKPEDNSSVVAHSRHEEMAHFYAGLELMKSEHFDKAAESFYSFLAVNPHHIYSDRAAFLIAQNLYQSKEYSLALTEFNRFLSIYPASLKRADGLFSKALCFKKMGMAQKSREAFRQLLLEQPQSEVSVEAARELAQLSERVKGMATRKMPLLSGK